MFFAAMMLAVSAGLSAWVVRVSAATTTISTTNTGWYADDGFHDPNNRSYIAGRVFTDDYGYNREVELRNFFIFDASNLYGNLTDVRLSVFNPPNGYISPSNSENYSLYSVSNSASSVQAGGSGKVSIFNDLGAGAVLGSKVILANDVNQNVEIDLSASGLSDLRSAAGGDWVVGGRLTTISGNDNQGVFLFSNNSTPSIDITYDGVEWLNPSTDSNWHVSANWGFQDIPDSQLDAFFSLPGIYTVELNADAQSDELLVRSGVVTFNLALRSLDVNNLLIGVGDGSGEATFDNGAVSSAGSITIGNDGDSGVLNIADSLTTFTQVGGFTYVGATDDGYGEVNVTQGGSMRSTKAIVGWQTGARGIVVVEGGGSNWIISESLNIGGFSSTGDNPTDTGRVVVRNGGEVYVAGTTTLWNGTGGLANKLAIVDGGRFTTQSLTFLDNDAPLESLDWRSGGTLILAGGTISGITGLTVGDGRVFEGTGTVENLQVLSGGLLRPGLWPGVGTLIIQGALQSDGTIELELDGTGSGEFDRLVVAGEAFIGGVIKVVLGFDPSNGDSFEVLDIASSIESPGDVYTFDFSQAALNPGLEWDTSDFKNSGVLRVISQLAALAGDYNENGTVEQGDLNIVLSNWGRPRAFEDGVSLFETVNVDQEELNVVLNNWGGSSAPNYAGSTVPEPALATLITPVVLVRAGRHLSSSTARPRTINPSSK
ncbi:MAG: hypothetical protein AAGJ38_02850 [Planctomycetota bacterium]